MNDDAEYISLAEELDAAREAWRNFTRTLRHKIAESLHRLACFLEPDE